MLSAITSPEDVRTEIMAAVRELACPVQPGSSVKKCIGNVMKELRHPEITFGMLKRFLVRRDEEYPDAYRALHLAETR